MAIEDALRHDTFKANHVISNTRHFWYDARYRLIRATGRRHATVQQKGEATVTTSPDPNEYDPYDLKYAYDEVGNFVRNLEYTSKRLHYKATRIDLFNGDATEATDDAPASGNWRYDDNGCATHTPRHAELRYSFDSQPRFVDMAGGGKVHYFRNADQRVVRMVKKPGVDGLGIYLGPWEYHWRDSSTDYAKVVLHAEGHGRHAQVERVFSGSDPDSEAIFFVHADHLQSGHVLTKDDGTLLSQEEYFPYGRSSDRRDARNRYRYIGVERDEDTGLGMTGPRVYDYIQCRFLLGDPEADAATHLTPYNYARSTPVARLDASGRRDVPASADARVASASHLRNAIADAARDYLAASPLERPQFGHPKFPSAMEPSTLAERVARGGAPVVGEPYQSGASNSNDWATPSSFLDALAGPQAMFDCRTAVGVWAMEGIRRVYGALKFDAKFGGDRRLVLPFLEPGRLMSAFTPLQQGSRLKEGDFAYFKNGPGFMSMVEKYAAMHGELPEEDAWKGEWGTKVGLDSKGNDLFAAHGFDEPVTAKDIANGLALRYNNLAVKVNAAVVDPDAISTTPSQAYTVRQDWETNVATQK